MCISHMGRVKDGSGVQADDFSLRQRRALMERWGDFLNSSESVLTLKAAKVEVNDLTE